MPVTRKGAGGANASTRMRFSGPTTAMKERRRRDTRTESVRASRDAGRTSSRANQAKAEEAREKRERHRDEEIRGDCERLDRPSSSREMPASRAKVTKMIRSGRAATR